MTHLDLKAIKADIERAKMLVGYIEKYDPTKRALQDALRDISTVANHVPALLKEVEALREDKARLDYLDEANQRLNAKYGTDYGWNMVMNHNVNRLYLKDVNTLDLRDSDGGYYKHGSCREAIDFQRDRTAWERKKLAAVKAIFPTTLKPEQEAKT